MAGSADLRPFTVSAKSTPFPRFGSPYPLCFLEQILQSREGIVAGGRGRLVGRTGQGNQRRVHVAGMFRVVAVEA